MVEMDRTVLQLYRFEETPSPLSGIKINCHEICDLPSAEFS
jgi:hypothetical protein